MDRPFSVYNGDEPYVFVSYSHRDSAVVFPELGGCETRGIVCTKILVELQHCSPARIGRGLFLPETIRRISDPRSGSV